MGRPKEISTSKRYWSKEEKLIHDYYMHGFKKI